MILQTFCLWLALCTPFQESERRDVGATLAWWREAVELDLPGDVLREEQATLERLPELARHGEALALRARARLLAGTVADARALLDAVDATEETRHHVTLARARVALEADELERVVSLLGDEPGTDVAESLRAHGEAYLSLGRAHMRAGRESEAAVLLKRFVELEPLHPEASAAWHALATHAGRLRQADRVQRYAAAAQRNAEWHAYYRARRIQIRENPQAILPRLGIVILWMRADLPREALPVLDEIFALDPDNCEAFGHLAEAHRKLEAWEDARAAYDKAIDCAPQNVGLRFNRAWTARQSGRPEDAVPDYEWIVASEFKEDPRFIDSYLQLARHAARQGDAAKSEERYARYRELGGTEPLEGEDG